MLIMAIMIICLIEFAVRPVVLAIHVRSESLFAHKDCYHHSSSEMASIHNSAKGKETEHSVLDRKGEENQLLVFL